MSELHKTANAPGYGKGRAFIEQRAQEAECIANLPDRARMMPVMASPSALDNWLIASFGNSQDDGKDWTLVTDTVRASELVDATFPTDAKEDAFAIAAILNAYRMGLLVVKEGDQ